MAVETIGHGPRILMVLAQSRGGRSLCDGSASSPLTLELHLRGLVELLALVDTDVEKLLWGEAERAGKQHGGELLDAGVVLLHGVVEEAAGGRKLVLDVGELALELLEVLIGLQVRIGFAEREQLSQRAGECVFGGCLRGNTARSGLDRGVAG